MKPTDLRGILRYIPRFREKVFILAIDGSIVTDDNFPNLLLDIAVLRSLNIRILLVHGAAKQIAALAEERGVKASNLDGTGITDAETLQLSLFFSRLPIEVTVLGLDLLVLFFLSGSFFEEVRGHSEKVQLLKLLFVHVTI